MATSRVLKNQCLTFELLEQAKADKAALLTRVGGIFLQLTYSQLLKAMKAKHSGDGLVGDESCNANIGYEGDTIIWVNIVDYKD